MPVLGFMSGRSACENDDSNYYGSSVDDLCDVVQRRVPPLPLVDGPPTQTSNASGQRSVLSEAARTVGRNPICYHPYDRCATRAALGSNRPSFQAGPYSRPLPAYQNEAMPPSHLAQTATGRLRVHVVGRASGSRRTAQSFMRLHRSRATLSRFNGGAYSGQGLAATLWIELRDWPGERLPQPTPAGVCPTPGTFTMLGRRVSGRHPSSFFGEDMGVAMPPET